MLVRFNKRASGLEHVELHGSAITSGSHDFEHQNIAPKIMEVDQSVGVRNFFNHVDNHFILSIPTVV